MAMILPKGILENTREIYAEVASYPVVPPEKIWQYWNVYTTTFRRLVDPTAYRLENFWWHVWGSDRRYLSGPELARLFEEFSNGPTFVPLRSPANRYEGPPTPRFSQHELDRFNSELGQPPNTEQDQDSRPGKANAKSPTPSSSRPPPTHPILKKSRGPSASGPRPTARFVSPHASDGEELKDGELSSGSTAVTSEMPPPTSPGAKREKGASTTVSEVSKTPEAPLAADIMPPPPLPVERRDKGAPAAEATAEAPRAEIRPPPGPLAAKGERGATPTRKIVVSTAASKRRPVLPRRASSQSSAGSDAGSRASSRENVSTMVAAGRHRPSPNITGPGRNSSQESGASSSSQTSQSSGLTMKAAGKRPAKTLSSRRSTPRSVPPLAESNPDRPVIVQQTPGVTLQRRSALDARNTPASQELALNRDEGARQPPPIAGFVADGDTGSRTPTISRSRSNVEASQGLQEAGAVRLPPQALVATTVVATSMTTAQGQFDSETITLTPTIPEARDIPDELMPSPRSSASALRELQFTPTPPNPTLPIPFGRSKSQLTLLLEREKARKGDGR